MDNIDNVNLELRIHYFFASDDIHQMDAKLHNEFEAQFLRAIDVLKTNIGNNFKVDILAKEQGSFMETFVIPFVKEPLVNLFNSFVNKFFSSDLKQKAELSLSEDRIKLYSEIKEKIKNNEISATEAELIVSDQKIQKCISENYKIIKESPVSKITTQTKLSNQKLPISETVISRSEFDTKIIKTEVIEQTIETTNTTIGILSPVLQEGHGTKWRGMYSGSTIDFKIEDKEFLKQVYNNEIKFGANTTITCTLQISTKETYENNEKINEDKISYIVTDVSQWADDETFMSNSKKYKKLNNNAKNYGTQLEINFSE